MSLINCEQNSCHPLIRVIRDAETSGNKLQMGLTYAFSTCTTYAVLRYFSAFLFPKASSYRCLEPFSDAFRVTSRLVLTQQPTLDELAELPVEDLASHLYELSVVSPSLGGGLHREAN